MSNQPNPAVELIDGGESNPYHFFIYMLTNFSVLDITKEIVYYYPNKNGCRTSEELLAMLPSTFIRHTEKQENLVYQPFLHSNPFFQNTLPQHFEDYTFPQYYSFLRSLYAPYCSPSIRQGLRIYISRNSDSSVRHVKNEESLIQKLQQLEFHCMKMTDYSLRDQIYIFSLADVIVAPHGASLAFLLFANPNVTIFEMNGQGRRHYSHIAWYNWLEYHRIPAKIVDEKETMEVDVGNMIQTLKCHKKMNIIADSTASL